jgi:hypothetical protein
MFEAEKDPTWMWLSMVSAALFCVGAKTLKMD